MKQGSYMWLGWATILSSLLLSSSVAFAYPPSGDDGSKVFEKTRTDINVMYRLDNNVTRSNTPLDIRSDKSISLISGVNRSFRLGENAGITLNGLLEAEKFQVYSGLGHVSAGFKGELFTRNYDELPQFSFFIQSMADRYQSKLRDGGHHSFGVSVFKEGTIFDTTFSITRAIQNGQSAVFNTRHTSANIRLGHKFLDSNSGSDRGSLHFSGEYQKGDSVSTGTPSLTLLDTATVFVKDDVFITPQLVSYRTKAQTFLMTLGYNIPIADDYSLDISWQGIASYSDVIPPFLSANVPYRVSQFSVKFSKGFEFK
ncbi:MAG: hypothetical protein PHI11_14400 [Gallionella sp.]|nr:hypothetical protein [Gallionella sp.]